MKSSTAAIAAFACLLIPSSTVGAATCVPSLLGADRRGPVEAIARNGDTIYLGAGAALQILDVTDPASPTQRSYLNLDSVVLDVANVGSLVAVLGRDELSLVDASDPSQPVRLGALDQLPRDADDFAMAPGVVYLASATRGLRVVDISDPLQPEVVLELPGNARDAAVFGPRAYVLRSGQLEVRDISDPTQPILVHTEPSNGSRLEVAGSGNRLAVVYYCSGHHSCSSITFHDLADPDHPVYRSRYDFWAGEDDVITSIAMSGGRAYLGTNGGVLPVLDLSDLGDPEVLETIESTSARAVAAAGTRLFVADDLDGFSIWAVPASAPAHRLGGIRTPRETTGGYFTRGFAVVTHLGGIRVYDVSDPTRPRVVGTHAAEGTDFYFAPLASYRDKGYVGRGDGDLRVIGALDPTSPGIGERLQLGGYEDVEKAGTHLFVQSNRYPDTGLLRIFDLEDPGRPAQVGELSGSPYIYDIAANARALFGVTYAGGVAYLRSWDLADPANPVLLGEQGSWFLGALEVHGHLLAATASEGFRLFDVRDPAAPASLAEVPLPDPPYSILLAPGRFVATFTDGWTSGRFQMFDLRDPTSPLPIADFPTAGAPRFAFSGPGLLAVADGAAGVSFYESCAPFADGFESGDIREWSPSGP